MNIGDAGYSIFNIQNSVAALHGYWNFGVVSVKYLTDQVFKDAMEKFALSHTKFNFGFLY